MSSSDRSSPTHPEQVQIGAFAYVKHVVNLLGGAERLGGIVVMEK